MTLKSLIIILVILTVQRTQQISLPSDPTYNAGVVEFIPARNGQGKSLVKDNLQRMKAIIESEQSKDLDILVFPEFVLNNIDVMTYVPDPKDKISPCEIPNYDWFLTELSCAIRSSKLYVVINVVEKFQCTRNEEHCGEEGLKKYNTNVVFDREGRVISRYRKTHLYRYEWYSENVLTKPELATFTTDFGVTFGHFICFDMLFYEPAQVLIRELNITDIVYPTYWFSELPFLTAVQLQEGWAFANNINVLAADASYPAGQNTGSGIYAGRLSRLTAVINEQPTTQVLTAKVPKRHSLDSYQMPPVQKPLFVPLLESTRYTKLNLLRDYNVDIFNTTLLEEYFTIVDEFHVKRVKITESFRHSSYRYRLAAYSGTRTTFQRIDSSNQSVCALIACTGEDLYTCGHIFPESVLVGNKYYFKTINITGDFGNSHRRLIMPSTVNSVILPLTVDSFEWQEKEENSTTTIQMSLLEPQLDLLTFGIWANYFSNTKNTHNLDNLTRDLQKPVKNSALSLGGDLNNLISSLFLGLLILSVKSLQ
ncbi:vanin-like protein 1 [Cochliomyia hominivorax]